MTIEEVIDLLCDPDATWLRDEGMTWDEQEQMWTRFPELHAALREQEEREGGTE